MFFSREVTSPAAFKAACGAYASGIAAADQVLVVQTNREAHEIAAATRDIQATSVDWFWREICCDLVGYPLSSQTVSRDPSTEFGQSNRLLEWPFWIIVAVIVAAGLLFTFGSRRGRRGK